MTAIPVAQASVGAREEKYVVDALASGWLSGNGPYVDRFEAEWARLCGARHAIAVASGTAALQLLLLALGVTTGDEVIVPALTFAAVANAVRHCGAVPVVVDVDAGSWCISPAAIRERADGEHRRRHRGTRLRTPGRHAGDLQGRRPRGLWVIEDGAEAHLATSRGVPVGNLATGAAFSFFGNKIVTTGEGGAVTTDDRELAAAARALSRQGVGERDDRYRPSRIGLGLRMGNLAAAVGCAQLERVDDLVDHRRAAVARYEAELRDVAGISFQPVEPHVVVAPWAFSVLVEPAGLGCSRDDLARALAGRGIETRALFPPLGSLPAARPARHPTPVADRLADTGLSLPLFAEISERQIERVVAAIRGTR